MNILWFFKKEQIKLIYKRFYIIKTYAEINNAQGSIMAFCSSLVFTLLWVLCIALEISFEVEWWINEDLLLLSLLEGF